MTTANQTTTGFDSTNPALAPYLFGALFDVLADPESYSLVERHGELFIEPRH